MVGERFRHEKVAVAEYAELAEKVLKRLKKTRKSVTGVVVTGATETSNKRDVQLDAILTALRRIYMSGVDSNTLRMPKVGEVLHATFR